MKKAWPPTAVFVLLCFISSCMQKPAGEEYVSQTIPIEIQSGKAVNVEIHVSNNGPNDVGIRCSPEVWNALTNGTKTITVQLKSSSGKDTNIYGVHPGGTAAGLLYVIPHVYYLFEIYGGYANAIVEITFPNAPEGITHTEIIVDKTPADTGL